MFQVKTHFPRNNWDNNWIKEKRNATKKPWKNSQNQWKPNNVLKVKEERKRKQSER